LLGGAGSVFLSGTVWFSGGFGLGLFGFLGAVFVLLFESAVRPFPLGFSGFVAGVPLIYGTLLFVLLFVLAFALLVQVLC